MTLRGSPTSRWQGCPLNPPAGAKATKRQLTHPEEFEHSKGKSAKAAAPGPDRAAFIVNIPEDTFLHLHLSFSDRRPLGPQRRLWQKKRQAPREHPVPSTPAAWLLHATPNRNGLSQATDAAAVVVTGVSNEVFPDVQAVDAVNLCLKRIPDKWEDKQEERNELSDSK